MTQKEPRSQSHLPAEESTGTRKSRRAGHPGELQSRRVQRVLAPICFNANSDSQETDEHDRQPLKQSKSRARAPSEKTTENDLREY
jgi:hypothetical protein